MNRTKISWTEYTWNPVVGCKNHCWYCYAERMNKRFKYIPKWDEPCVKVNELYTPKRVPKEPSKIFVGSMCDLFGNWISKKIIEDVLVFVKKNPQHTFQVLTKNPKRYKEFEFPKNCWLGQTITGKENIFGSPIYKDNITYYSFEPLLDYINIDSLEMLPKWIILGAYTGPGSKKYQPKKEWIDSIVRQCKHYKIPIFMKESLKDIWDKPLIQEFPE